MKNLKRRRKNERKRNFYRGLEIQGWEKGHKRHKGAYIEDYDSRRKEKLMTFGEALALLKNGKKVARRGWKGKGLWLELQIPDKNSKMTLPYVYLNYPSGDKYHDGSKVPWLPSQTDMLEEDWVEVE